jgi:3-hydroxyacyl-CoA dehydrogenase
MRRIRKIAVLGGDGTMGSQSGGIFAQAGLDCAFFAPSVESAKLGIENAVKQARSDVLRHHMVPRTFESLDELREYDWIVEAVSEDLSLKRDFFRRVDACRREGSIVSTMSSGLSIEELAAECSDDFKAHFMGVHFFNPPTKLLANELTFHPRNAEELRKFVQEFCEKTLRRVNVVTHDRPGFAGNRIGFQFLNEAVQFAEKYGVELIDYALGPFTGRVLPPLATIDLVGLDVHRAIVDNIFQSTNDERHETFRLPDLLQRMIDRGMLGNKSGAEGGFYRLTEEKNTRVIEPRSLAHRDLENIRIDPIERIKLHLHDGEYARAIRLLKHEDSEALHITRHFILSYVAYSFARIGEVTPGEHGIHGIDRVMAYGFSWLPPSAWIDFLGGPGETRKLLERWELPVPESLKELPEMKQCRIPEVTKFLIAR